MAQRHLKYSYNEHIVTNPAKNMATTMHPPRARERKKERKPEDAPQIVLLEAQKSYPTRVANQEAVIEAFRIQSAQQYFASTLKLPDYVLEQGGYLFPFHGCTVRELLECAKRLKVKIDIQHRNENILPQLRCTSGWSLLNLVPIPRGSIRNHMNGYRYRHLSFADALMFFIWQIDRGMDPFVLRGTCSVHFLENGTHYWIRFEKERRMLSILDDTSEENGRYACLQQISEMG